MTTTLKKAAEALALAALKAELHQQQRDAWDTHRAIGLALGLPEPPDPMASDAPLPPEWAGLLSEKVAALKAEVADLKSEKGLAGSLAYAMRVADAALAERDRMAAALREIQLEAGGGIEAAREGSPIQHCFIAIHRHAAAALASDAPPLNECARAALSQEPTQ